MVNYKGNQLGNFVDAMIDFFFQLNLKNTLELGRMKDAEIAKLKEIVARHEATMAEMEDKMREHEMVRRKLHNTIQELKVKVTGSWSFFRPLINGSTAYSLQAALPLA